MRSRKGSVLKSWIIFVALILIAFAVLVFFQRIRKAPEAPPVAPEAEVEKKPRKLPKIAVRELTEDEKENLDNEALNQAMQSGTGCEAIEFDLELRQQCLDTLLYNAAIQKNDKKRCQELTDPDLKTKCLDRFYFNIATQGFDRDLCQKITEAQLKQNCLDQIQAFLGRSAESAASCDGIQDEDLKQTCLDNFHFSSSIENLDPVNCENIRDIKLKDRCSKTVAKNIEVIEISKKQILRPYKSNAEKLLDCDKLSGESADTCKSEINYNLALEKKDLSYCNAIEDNQKQTQCVRVQSANINRYYLRQATSKKDPGLCNKILDAGLRETCLTYAQ